MKNLKLMALALLFLVVGSCQKDEFGGSNTSNTNSENMELNKPGDSEIYAMNINNGIDCNCENNILVFPNWQTFYDTRESLENQWEQHVTAFSQSLDPTMTDLEIEAYADSIGFQDEQAYLDFEATYQFASLRKKIYDERTAWLKSLGQFEEWNTDEDPDSHFIWYETRVLLNEQAEVIVKDSIGNNVIYKFYPGGGQVEIRNDDYSALQTLNTSPIPPTDPSITYSFSNPCFPYYSNDPWDNFPGSPCEISGGGGSEQPPLPACMYENDIRKAFSTGSDTKIETVDFFRYYAPSLGNPKIKAKTEYFRWKDYVLWEGWTRGRTTLTAGITAEEKLDCSGVSFFAETMKTDHRHKVKAKWTWHGSYMGIPGPKAKDNMLYATHKRRQDVTKIIDYYDGDVQ